jgi:hypothetical protein
VKISRSGLFGIVAVTSFAAGASVDATTINFSVPSGYSGAGASTVDSGNTWNAIAIGGTTTSSFASDGSPSSVELTDTNAQNSNDNYYYNLPAGTIGLFSPYEYTFNATTQTDTLSGVSPGLYALYLYGVNGGYATDDTSFTATGSGAGSTSFGASDDNGGNSQTFALDVNYVVIPVTVGSGGSTITFSYVGALASDNAYDGDFNGLQLVSVPEPGSLCFLGLGALGLLSVRRRA